MPIGFYERVDAPVHVGSLVAVCLPKAVAAVGVKQGYLVNGPCPANAIAVLKEVIALPGDTVHVDQKSMTVGLQTYAAPVETHDHLGRPVKRFIDNGIYHVKNTLWLYGENDTVHSWDSRYYGGIPLKNVQGVYTPVLTF